MKATPTEVRRSIAADFKRRGITYEFAAKQLGFKNKQTVANIVSRKNQKYFTEEQALRFHCTYDYQIRFLTTGEGELFERKHDPMEGIIDINPPFAGLPPEVLVVIIDVAESIINACGKQAAEAAWASVMKGDFVEFQQQIHLLADREKPYPTIPVLTHYACEKIKEKNEEGYRSSYIYGKDEQEFLP